MTDQPTTQERCPTCGSLDSRARRCTRHDGFHTGPHAPHPPADCIACTDPWHGSQDVEGGVSEAASTEAADRSRRGSEATNASRAAAPSTLWNELRELVYWRIPAEPSGGREERIEEILRSLRTQQAEMQAELVASRSREVVLREQIAKLKAVLREKGVVA